jgi:hypothetical protein
MSSQIRVLRTARDFARRTLAWDIPADTIGDRTA